MGILRTLKRSVARNNMKRAGVRRINKHDKGVKSYFAEKWRDFVSR